MAETIRTTATITAENSFTGWLRPGAGQEVDVSVWGTFTATVTLQRRKPGAATILDVETYTAATEKVAQGAGDWEWRLGVKTGDFTSGTVNAALGV